MLRGDDGAVPRHRTALLLGLTAFAVEATACSSVENDGSGGSGGKGQSSTGTSTQSYPASGTTKYASPGISSVTGSGATTGANGFGEGEDGR